MIHDILARYKKWCQDSRWGESVETSFYYIFVPLLVAFCVILIVFSCIMLVVAVGAS